MSFPCLRNLACTTATAMAWSVVASAQVAEPPAAAPAAAPPPPEGRLAPEPTPEPAPAAPEPMPAAPEPMPAAPEPSADPPPPEARPWDDGIRRVDVRYHPQAAIQHRLFLEMVIGGTSWNERFQSYFNPGLAVGTFAGRFRLAALLVFLAADPSDRFGGRNEVPAGFRGTNSANARIVWAAVVGYAVAATRNYAWSPGITVMRADVAAYGTFLGPYFPFDWVTNGGVRVGFDVAFGLAVGGDARATCTLGPPSGQCSMGEVRRFDRKPEASFYTHFKVGFGAGHPKPEIRVVSE